MEGRAVRPKGCATNTRRPPASARPPTPCRSRSRSRRHGLSAAADLVLIDAERGQLAHRIIAGRGRPRAVTVLVARCRLAGD
jgi:hypothetical protein